MGEELEPDELNLFFLFLPQHPRGERDGEEEEACEARNMTGESIPKRQIPKPVRLSN